MQTDQITLSNTEWTQVGLNHGTVAIDIKTAGQILVHLNAGATPSIDAPGVAYGSWADGPDVVFEGLTGADAIWCRSVGPSAVIVAVRK